MRATGQEGAYRFEVSAPEADGSTDPDERYEFSVHPITERAFAHLEHGCRLTFREEHCWCGYIFS